MKHLSYFRPAAEGALVSAYSFFILLAYFFFLVSPTRYAKLVVEDGLVENLTALLLFACALLCGYKVLKAHSTKVVVFYFVTCLFFLFGTGEELSWGQRIFQFSTPESIKSLNTQGEFNVHNLEISGIRWNKVLFGLGLYGGVFCYFLLFPFLFQAHAGFRQLACRYQFPIPKGRHSVFYILSFLLVLLIPRGHHKWELQEFLFSGYIFLTFLYPTTSFNASGTAAAAMPFKKLLATTYCNIPFTRRKRFSDEKLPHT